MAEFDNSQQKIITDFFKALNMSDIKYVVVRGYRNLPESVPGVDIDIFVHESDFTKSVNLVDDLGFIVNGDQANRVKQVLNVGSKALRQPGKAVNKAVSDPVGTVKMVTGSTQKSESFSRGYRETKRVKSGVHIHLFNHLAYMSTLNRSMIRVDPSVEEGMAERRIKNGSIFATPSPPDELAHLVCRGVFDKEGNFPDYYINQCDDLWSSVQQSEQHLNTLDNILNNIFFQADVIVKNAIENSSYGALREDLLRFDDY